jgi:hypothetical protein
MKVPMQTKERTLACPMAAFREMAARQSQAMERQSWSSSVL